MWYYYSVQHFKLLCRLAILTVFYPTNDFLTCNHTTMKNMRLFENGLSILTWSEPPSPTLALYCFKLPLPHTRRADTLPPLPFCAFFLLFGKHGMQQKEKQKIARLKAHIACAPMPGGVSQHQSSIISLCAFIILAFYLFYLSFYPHLLCDSGMEQKAGISLISISLYLNNNVTWRALVH